MAVDFYGKGSDIGKSNMPNYYNYPSLKPKNYQEQWNDIVVQFNAWVTWGSH